MLGEGGCWLNSVVQSSANDADDDDDHDHDHDHDHDDDHDHDHAMTMMMIMMMHDDDDDCFSLSRLLIISRVQQGAPREGGEASLPKKYMDGSMELGDVKRLNPEQPWNRVLRLEEPRLRPVT